MSDLSFSVCGRVEFAGYGDVGNISPVAGGGCGLLPGQLHPEPGLVGKRHYNEMWSRVLGF